MVNRLSPYNQFKLIANENEWSGLTQAEAIDVSLPYGAELCTTGIKLPDTLDLKEWKEVGLKLMMIEKCVIWALADWWCWGYHKYGERAEVAKKLPYQFGTLMNYGRVARKIEPSLRNEALSFTHHVAVATLKPDEQKKWLARAFRGSAARGTPAKPWSVSQLRQAIHDATQTGKEMEDREAEQNDPDVYRKDQSLASAINALDRFEKITKGDHFLTNSIQAITTDQPFLADVPDHMIANLIEVASSIAEMFNKVVSVLKQHQVERLARLAGEATDATEEVHTQKEVTKKSRTRIKVVEHERMQQAAE